MSTEEGIHFTRSQCLHLRRTIGSFDWGPGPGGSEHVRRIETLLQHGAETGRGAVWRPRAALYGPFRWTDETVRMFYSLAKATCKTDDLYRGAIVAVHRTPPPLRTRRAIMRHAYRMLELTGIGVIDLLAMIETDD